MTLRFTLDDWAAWAPGLTDHEVWLRWLAAPVPVSDEGMPALTEMPAMMRRRVESLGRTALQTAYWAQGDAPACPVIFASRYGDTAGSIALLRQLARGESLSPTGFSMSVHNAIGALFSIARADSGAYVAIAGGEDTTETAFVEALGLLVDGAPAVLVVIYDEPLSEPYDVFTVANSNASPERAQCFRHAWACRIRLAEADEDTQTTAGVSFSLSSAAPGMSAEVDVKVDTDVDAVASNLVAAGSAQVSLLAPDLAVLQFLTGSGAQLYEHRTAQRCWHWQRHLASNSATDAR